MKCSLFVSKISGLSFKLTNVGGGNGQTDMKITAYLKGKVVGYLLYSDYKDKAYINYIEVIEDMRGQGIGEQLMLQLAKEYSWTNIVHGMQTEEGHKLVNKMKKIFEPYLKRGVDMYDKPLIEEKKKFDAYSRINNYSLQEIVDVFKDHLPINFKIDTQYVQDIRLMKEVLDMFNSNEKVKGEIRGNHIFIKDIKFIRILFNYYIKNDFSKYEDSWNELYDLTEFLFNELKE